MRLVNNLRKAEEKSVMAIRRGVDRAREDWADVERRIRQRMRIYPPKQQAMASTATLEQEVSEGTRASQEERRPIVSIHGQDLKA